MADNMLSVVKYDAGGVEIKLEPETVKIIWFVEMEKLQTRKFCSSSGPARRRS